MSEKVNRIRNEFNEIRKPARKEKAGGESRLSFLQNERFTKISGLLLLLFSLYLFVAFCSFLFTWKIDQSVVAGAGWNVLFDPERNPVENWLGIVGAVVSHQFIHNWFGLSSFAFVFIFFLIGYRVLFKVSLLNIPKSLAYAFFLLIYVSIFFGFILSFFQSDYYFLAGAFGLQTAGWLNQVLGKIGTGALLLFTGLSTLVIAFNINFRIKKEETEEEEELVPAPVENLMLEEEKPSDPIEFPLDEDETGPEPVLILAEEPPFPAMTPEAEDVKLDINPAEQEVLAEEPAERFGEYDPTLDLSSYRYPTLDLLENYGTNKISVNTEELEANKNKIVETLGHYNIDIDKIKATIGPTVTLYEIIPAAGIRISKIKNLEDDIALSLSALGIRIIAPIPGKGTIGIEVPNQNPEMVSMRSVLATEKFQNNTMDLPVALGKTISNEVFITDLAKMPHLLMAGATGQGKSVGINALLVSLLYKKHPSQLKFVMVDPKKVELTLFRKIERHFLAKLPGEADAIITDTRKVISTLNSLCIEMDQRYDLLKDAHVRNLKEYNQKFISRKLNPNEGHRFMPFIVLVIDEFADLMMTAGKEIEAPIARLAQLARAIGIHLVIATQRPSVNIITGTIKANFPARIAFRVTSKIDSRTILDSGGAEQLIGRGDMLLSNGNDLIRLQCAFVDTPEVEKITEYIGSQRGYPDAHLLPEYVDESSDSGGIRDFDPDQKDPLFEDAARLIVMHQQGSTSLIQRKLKLGYNRAGRIIDQLEAAGVVGPFEGSKAREVLISDEYSLEQFLNNMKQKEL